MSSSSIPVCGLEEDLSDLGDLLPTSVPVPADMKSIITSILEPPCFEVPNAVSASPHNIGREMWDGENLNTPPPYFDPNEIQHDCAVKQVRDGLAGQETQKMKPTARVEPRQKTVMESLDTEDEEDEGKGNTLLSYFPFMVLVLILAVLAGSLVGASCHQAMLVGLVSVLCVVSAGLYQSFTMKQTS